MQRLLLSILPFFLVFSTWAGEGMWLPFLLKQLNEKEMHSMGMKMSAEDIYSVNKGSLKDAIVHFGGFCTAEVISPEGLLLTNWHCGRGTIQSHSSLENNYLEEGFWAMARSEELPNPGLTATFIVRMEDITDEVLKGVSDAMPLPERQSLIDRNSNEIMANCEKKSYEEARVRPIFNGNQYILIITATYRDVRLVGTPPQSIGEFGSDTDNWVWPRHTGDFSLFRIYAGPNNEPADYSLDNKPYQPKHFLPISLKGVKEDDFTLVFGFPGTTSEYLPASAVEQIIYKRNPVRIAIRDKTLNILGREMRNDEKVKIQYTSKFSRLSNSWKRWKGEILGMNRTNGIEQKQAMEATFQKRVEGKKAWRKAYGDLLDSLNVNYERLEPYVIARDYYSEITGRNIEIFRAANLSHRLISAYRENGEAGFEMMKERFDDWYENFFKDYRPDIDRQVFAAQMDLFVSKVPPEFISPQVTEGVASGGAQALADQVYDNSVFTSAVKFEAALELSPEEAVEVLAEDPAHKLVRAMLQTYNEEVAPHFNRINTDIYALEKTYMTALMEVFPEKTFYPDANSTMRVTYGKVKGYEARDAVTYEPYTTLEGVMEKYVPGDYEFDVPEKLIELYEDKDYGPYGQNGEMPVCFVGTNHTTGGNSGSPAINAHGHLVGLNFDRAWEGVMSDYHYDASICRNIMVDLRYILFIIDKYAGAGHLVEEMELVK